MQLEKIAIKKLKSAKYNPRKDLCEKDQEYQSIKNSIDRFGYIDPIIWNRKTGNVVGGHQRLKILQAQGASEVDVVVVEFDEEQEKACNIALNKVSGLWDQKKLESLFDELNENAIDLQSLGITDDFMQDLFGTKRSPRDEYEINKGSLSERFLFPPLSVLDARTGIWQERKKIWQKILNSGEGRDDTLIGKSLKVLVQRSGSNLTGTSIFDPVLCELLIQWFSPANGKILDPFAGGSVRGMVSSFLGRYYTGFDISPSQVEANRETARQFEGTENLFGNPFEQPKWINEDSQKIIEVDDVEKESFDFLLSCPPYGDLEKYSDDPNDISTKQYSEFKECYRNIIEKSCRLLKSDSFACFVVGEIRDKNGFYRSFVPDTVQAFRDAGLEYYNEAILITMCMTLSLRAGGQFSKTRKLGKSHQNVLVFAKGNPTINHFEKSRQLAETHKDILVFIKGDPKQATNKLDRSIDNLLPEVPIDE